MSEYITITVSLEQASALIDAAKCASLAAEGHLDDVIKCFTPAGISLSRESDRFIREQAELAQEAADKLRPEIIKARSREPNLQDFLHRVRMLRKRGLDSGA
jgi:hypothetical protein